MAALEKNIFEHISLNGSRARRNGICGTDYANETNAQAQGMQGPEAQQQMQQLESTDGSYEKLF